MFLLCSISSKILFTFSPFSFESFPDLNGENLTPFQRSLDVADQAHKSSLSLVPGPPSNSPFQDRNDGATPEKYIDNLPQ